MAKAKKNSLLWRISKPDLPFVSYVFGTMHVKDKKAFGKIEFLEKTILECSAFAAEFNLDDIDQSLIDQHLTLNNNLLSDLIKPKYFQKLDNLTKKAAGIPLKLIENKTPFFVISVLTETLFQSEMPEALDHHLHNFAKDNHKNIFGIEHFDEQIEVLKNIKLKDQLKSLNWIIKNYGSFRKQHIKAAEYYVNEDILALFRSVKKSSKGMRKTLIYKRNKTMADRIADFAHEQSIFSAIGAGHLAGEKGVLRLLKQKGFKVVPVKMVGR